MWIMFNDKFGLKWYHSSASPQLYEGDLDQALYLNLRQTSTFPAATNEVHIKEKIYLSRYRIFSSSSKTFMTQISTL